MTLSTLGERLAHARSLSLLSASELALLAGLKNTSHVGMIERGERPNVAAETAVALCEVLGCDERWLVRGTGDPPAPESVRAAVARAREARADLATAPTLPPGSEVS